MAATSAHGSLEAFAVPRQKGLEPQSSIKAALLPYRSQTYLATCPTQQSASMTITHAVNRDILLPPKLWRKKRQQHHDTPQSSFRVLGCYPENFRPEDFMRIVDDPDLDCHLCPRCRRISFQAIFDLDYERLPDVGKPVFELTDVRKSMLWAACSLCRLFGKMIFEYDCSPYNSDDQQFSWERSYPVLTGEEVHFRAYKNATYDQLEKAQHIPISRQEIVIGVVNGLVFGINHATMRHTFISQSTLRRVRPAMIEGSSVTTYAISLPICQAAIETAGSILHHCLRNHKDCHSGSAFITSAQGWGRGHTCLTAERRNSDSSDLPNNARVIHCISRRIVPWKRGMKYLALSYVWGPQSNNSLDTLPGAGLAPKSLPAKLPQTIEDAISLTLRLGFQYVWIDRFCIEQHHSEDKQHQIGQMSTIYSTAVATICALGSDDSTGIAGVSRAIQYTSASSQGLQVISIVHKVRHHVRKSVWSTRGWTLQEVMVSPRCILFTEEGVIMVCRGGTLNERTVLKDSFGRSKADFDRIGLLFVTSNRADYEKAYATEYNPEQAPFRVLRNEYQKRCLSYDDDAYDAFSAILSQMRTPSYWGLINKGHPDRYFNRNIQREDWNKYTREGIAVGFAQALTWYVVNPFVSKRRTSNELPSWSWFSQTGKIEDWLCRENPLFCPEIDVVSHDRKTCLDVASSFLSSGCLSLMPRESKYLLIKSMVVKWKLTGQVGKGKAPAITIEPSEVGKWSLLGPHYPSSDKPCIYFDNRDEHNDIRLPQSGRAILLTMDGDKHQRDTSWMAIECCKDGTYCRVGIIRTFRDHKDFGWQNSGLPGDMKFMPPPEFVKTVWLG